MNLTFSSTPSGFEQPGIPKQRNESLHLPNLQPSISAHPKNPPSMSLLLETTKVRLVLLFSRFNS